MLLGEGLRGECGPTPGVCGLVLLLADAGRRRCTGRGASPGGGAVAGTCAVLPGGSPMPLCGRVRWRCDLRALALRWRLVDSAQKSWKKFLHLYIEYVYNN